MASLTVDVKNEFTEPLLDSLERVDSQQIIHRYEKFAPVYDRSVSEWGYDIPQICTEYFQQLGFSQSCRILDAGCGTGLVGKALCEAGYQDVEGNDLSSAMLAIAKQTGAYKNLSQQDLLDPPYGYDNKHFSAIACVGVFSLIKDPKPVLKEFCRIVKRGGYLLFTQRESFYTQYNYPLALEQLEQEGLLRRVSVSDPINYLPNRKGYENCTLVILVCEVLLGEKTHEM